MNLLERVRAHREAEDIAGPIGVRACVGHGVRLDTKASNYDVEGIATTDEVDCEGDVVLPGGCDIFSTPKTCYMARNRKVFVDHWTDTGSLVGILRTWKLIEGTPGGIRVRVGLQKSCQFTPIIAELAGSVGIGFSIGFVPTEYGAPTAEEAKKYPGARNIIRRWEWYELSCTPFPCNVSCQTSGAHEVGAEYAERALKALRQKSSPEARRLMKYRTLVIPPERLVVDFPHET